jgi:catechol 2,3-dioxygenase-like lactoylglutathione lyase family enzyme
MSGVSRRSLVALGLAAGSGTFCGPAAAAGGGHNPVLGKSGLHHAAVRTRDWDRTLAFYQQVLGCTVRMAWEETLGDMSERLAEARPRNQRWAYLDVGNGTYIEVFEDFSFVPPAADASDPTRNAGGAHVHMGLRTSRIDHVFEIARSHGVTTLGAPQDFTLHTTTGQGPIVVRLCFLQGPSGEWIELIQGST